MPLNPQIPLGGGGAGSGLGAQGFFDTLGSLYKLDAYRDEAENRRAILRERQQKEQDRETFNKAYGSSKTRTGTLQYLRDNDAGHLITQASEFFDKLEKAENDRQKANRESAGAQALAILQQPEERRQASYELWEKFVLEKDPEFYGPQVANIREGLSKYTDPAERQAALNQFIEGIAVNDPNYDEVINAQASRARERTTAEAAERKAPGERADAAAANLKNTSMQLAALDKEPEKYRLFRQTLPGGMSFPAEYDYDRIIQIGNTPHEQAEETRLTDELALKRWEAIETQGRLWQAEGRQQADQASGGVTDKIRNTADKEMQTDLQILENSIRKGLYGDWPKKVDWAAVDAAKLSYYNTYRRQLKLPTRADLPPEFRSIQPPKQIGPPTPPEFGGPPVAAPPTPAAGYVPPAPTLGSSGMMPLPGQGSLNPPPILRGPARLQQGPPPIVPPPVGPPQAGMNAPFGGIGGAQVNAGQAPGVSRFADAPRGPYAGGGAPPMGAPPAPMGPPPAPTLPSAPPPAGAAPAFPGGQLSQMPSTQMPSRMGDLTGIEPPAAAVMKIGPKPANVPQEVYDDIVAQERIGTYEYQVRGKPGTVVHFRLMPDGTIKNLGQRK